MITNRENILVTEGNMPLLTANTPLYNQDGSVNLAAGQLGVFDAKTLKAIDSTTPTIPARIFLAVGTDYDNDGVAETAQRSAGDHMSLRTIGEATAEPPRGECAEVVDFLFNCTECNKDYGMKIVVDHSFSSNFFPMFTKPVFPINIVSAPCATCTTGCDEVEHNCNDVVCKILDQINQTTKDVNNITKANLVNKKFPFEVERLYSTISHLALPCTTDSCGGEYLCKLDTITIDNAGTPYTLNVTTQNPSLAGTMLAGQAKVLQAELNRFLETNNVPGKFHVSQKCSDTCFEITLNSCATITAATFAGACTTTITLENPLQTVVPTTCTDCTDAGNTIKTFTCGIRFIGKLDTQECGCFPPKEYTRSRWSRLEVYGQTGFQDWVYVRKQDQKLSEGMGLDLRWRQFKQEVGGPGRETDMYITTYGKHGAHGDRYKKLVSAKCVPYCQYAIRHFSESNSATVAAHNTTWQVQFLSVVAVPQKDVVTKASFEAFINPYLAQAMPMVESITCDEDKDQTEPRFEAQ